MRDFNIQACECLVVCLCVLVFFKVYLALFWNDREENFMTGRYLPYQFLSLFFQTPTLSELNRTPSASIKACIDFSNRHCGFSETRKSSVLLLAILTLKYLIPDILQNVIWNNCHSLTSTRLATRINVENWLIKN